MVRRKFGSCQICARLAGVSVQDMALGSSQFDDALSAIHAVI